MFNILMFIIWVASLIMMFVVFHWGWLVAFIITTICFVIQFGVSGGTWIDIDIDL